MVVVVLCWAFNFVALKEVYPQISAPALSLLRFAAMYGALLVLCVALGEPLSLPKQHRVRICVVGFLSMGVYMVLFLEGMRGTSAAEGAIMLASAPVLTYLFACVGRQEPFLPVALAGSFIAFAGVALVVFGKGSAAPHGALISNLLVFASAIVWALSVVVMRPALVDVSPLRLLTLSMPVALLALVPYGCSALLAAPLGAVTAYGWMMFAHVALLSGVLAFVLFYRGIKQIGAGAATTYQFFVPPCAALFSWLVQGDRLTAAQFVGLCVVILGVATSSRARAGANR